MRIDTASLEDIRTLHLLRVMAGLVPAIHALLRGQSKGVDPRDKPGGDG
jgi:hypothetical protein